MAVQKPSRWAWLGMLACLLAQPSLAATEAPIDGMALYQKHCAACHEGKVPRAPHMITFSTIGAEAVLTAMNEGVMRSQASALSATEREVLAGFLAGEAVAPPEPIMACAQPWRRLREMTNQP